MREDHDPRVFKLLGFAAIVALIGLLGSSLVELAKGWDDLAGWQRGALGGWLAALTPS